MTNFEWLKSMDMDDFAEWVDIIVSGEVYDDMDDRTSWCNGNDDDCANKECSDCIKKWLNAKHIAPIPALEDGIFVGVQVLTYGTQTGVIVGDNIIYQTGAFDSIDEVKDKIVKVYNARCFDGCLESNVIWSKL